LNIVDSGEFDIVECVKIVEPLLSLLVKHAALVTLNFTIPGGNRVCKKERRNDEMSNGISSAFQRVNQKIYPTPPKIGLRYEGYNGQIWEVVGHNDLNYPYVSLLVKGKVQRKRYVASPLDFKKIFGQEVLKCQETESPLKGE
jgi:hypothetical protein